jgi:hypothetical protein
MRAECLRSFCAECWNSTPCLRPSWIVRSFAQIYAALSSRPLCMNPLSQFSASLPDCHHQYRRGITLTFVLHTAHAAKEADSPTQPLSRLSPSRALCNCFRHRDTTLSTAFQRRPLPPRGMYAVAGAWKVADSDMAPHMGRRDQD